MKVKVSYISSLILIISVLLGAIYVFASITGVTTDSPVDRFNTTNTSITFRCSATETGATYVRNISLGFNFSDFPSSLSGNTSMIINTTQNLSNGTSTSVFTITGLPDGVYSWGCLGANFSAMGIVANTSFDQAVRNNNASLTKLGSVNISTNRTIIVDTVGPANITLIFPYNASGRNLTDANFVNGTVTVAWSVVDTRMTSSLCDVFVNDVRRAADVRGNSSGLLAFTSVIPANFTADVLGFDPQITNNTWYVTCTDELGNMNITGVNRTASVNLSAISDTVAPVINNIDQKLKFKGTVSGQRDVENTKFDFGSPVNILGCNGTDNVDYFSTNATIRVKKPGASDFSGDIKNDTGGIEKFEFTDTSDLGFYVVNCTIRDTSGNQNSTAKNFEIIRTAVRGSGAAAIPGFKFTKGKTIVGSDTKNDAGALTTTESSWLFRNGGTVAYLVAGESHSFQVTNIGEKSVTIRVSSNPFDVTVNEDETKNIDVNGDGSADVAITLNGFTANGNADLTFKEVGAGTPADVGPGGEIEPITGTGPGTLVAGNGMWMVIAIIVVVLVVGYFLIKRR